MEDMKTHLQKQIDSHEKQAHAHDIAVIDHQRQIAVLRAHAGQSRAFAEECRKLLAMYEPHVQPATDLPEPQAEPQATSPTYEDVARNMNEWRGVPEAEEQLRVGAMLNREYDSASKEQRAGRSRWQYVTQRAREMDDALREAKPQAELPKYVWLTEAEATQQQKLMALSKQGDRYAVAVEDLTNDQALGRVPPTSDAADFGGLPG